MTANVLDFYGLNEADKHYPPTTYDVAYHQSLELSRERHMATFFLDMLVSLDTIDHRIFIDKLEHMGIRNNVLSWFQSGVSLDQKSWGVTCYFKK